MMAQLARTGHVMKRITAVMAAIVVVVIVVVAAIALIPPTKNSKVIYWTTVAPGLQQAAIAENRVQGGVSWEPYVSDSILGGTATAVVWSGDFWPDHPCCVLIVKDGFDTNLAERVLKADIDATNWLVDTLVHKGTADYTLLMPPGRRRILPASRK